VSDKINIEIICDVDVSIDSIKALEKISKIVLLQNSVNYFNANILLTDDETIQDLNYRYRGLNEVTDVLSFSDKYQGQYYGDVNPSNDLDENLEFLLPEDIKSQLGEIAISVPQAIRQAKFNLESELIKLVAHGFLHLLGYDHILPAERIIMEKLESEAIDEVSDIV